MARYDRINYVDAAYQYRLEMTDDILSCQGKNNLFFGNVADISQLEFLREDDDYMMVNGSFFMTIDFRTDVPLRCNAIIKHKIRGAWVQIPFVYEMPDFCAVEYKPDEIWAPITAQFEGEARECPLKKGVPLTIKEVKIGGIFDFPNKIEDGEYLGEMTLSQAGKSIACLGWLANLNIIV